MNVEEIDAHVEAHLNEEAADTSAMSEQQIKLFNICAVLQGAKPILKFVRGFLFFKPRWVKVIDNVIAVIDDGCPNP